MLRLEHFVLSSEIEMITIFFSDRSGAPTDAACEVALVMRLSKGIVANPI